MLLSIIIPVYNLEDYIGRCLDSCLAQTAQGGYEIICVNDGSKDNSLSILRDYESRYPNIRVIDKPNGGVSSARNAGIREARGQYIWFVDGDDWIAEKSIDKIERELINYGKNVDCVIFGYKRTDTYEKNEFEQKEVNSYVKNEGYVTLKDKYMVEVWCRWVNSSLITDRGVVFDERMTYAEDILFTAIFNSFCASTLVIAETVYYYFQRESSAMHQLDASKHYIAMFQLAVAYKSISTNTNDVALKKRMKNATIRAMQASCRDLCIYCSDRKTVAAILKQMKRLNMYPYGVDWKQFRIDRKQSRKNDLMNWLFGLLSFKTYFWCCWFFCAIPFKSKRKNTPLEQQEKILRFLMEK